MLVIEKHFNCFVNISEYSLGKNIFFYLFFLLFIISPFACSSPYTPNKNVIKTMKESDFFDDNKVQQLAAAAAQGQVDSVNDLVKNQGVDPNTLGKKGMTPLWWAFATKNKQGMQALMNNGAQADMTSDDITMLDMSVGGDDYELTKILLEGGANPNRIKNDTKKTPIFSAIYGRKIENVKILQQFKVNLNAKDKCDNTPLSLAVKIRSFDIVIWLLKQGADVQIVNKNGGTIAWNIHKNLTKNLYSPSAKQAALQIKTFLEGKGVVFPPLSPAQNRRKLDLGEPCYN